MVNIEELQPSSIEAFKKIYTEKKETLEYMLKFGTKIEKAIAKMILTAGGGKNE
jgi:hypothetical protein